MELLFTLNKPSPNLDNSVRVFLHWWLHWVLYDDMSHLKVHYMIGNYVFLSELLFAYPYPSSRSEPQVSHEDKASSREDNVVCCDT